MHGACSVLVAQRRRGGELRQPRSEEKLLESGLRWQDCGLAEKSGKETGLRAIVASCIFVILKYRHCQKGDIIYHRYISLVEQRSLLFRYFIHSFTYGS